MKTESMLRSKKPPICFFRLSFFAAVLFTLAGCDSVPVEDISEIEQVSEISLSMHTGLTGVMFTIVFRRDAAASCECSLDGLNKNKKPNVNYFESVCGGICPNNRSPFAETKETNSKDNLERAFVGNVSKEKFEQLAQLVDKNGFFSMNDKYIEKGLKDAPPENTKIVYASGKTKEVSDNGGKGGEKLEEIKRAIYETAKETKWESKRK